MDKWFAVSKDGLRGLVADRPKSFIVRELVQNAWDEPGVTKVEVRISPIEGSRYRLTVEDDAPEGLDRIVVAAVAAPATEGVQEPSVRHEGQQVADGLEAGAVVEAFPGEQGLSDAQTQGRGSSSPRRAR